MSFITKTGCTLPLNGPANHVARCFLLSGSRHPCVTLTSSLIKARRITPDHPGPSLQHALTPCWSKAAPLYSRQQRVFISFFIFPFFFFSFTTILQCSALKKKISDAPIRQTQESRQLHASVFVDVNVEEELPLQLSDLLLGVRTALLPPHTRLRWRHQREKVRQT